MPEYTYTDDLGHVVTMTHEMMYNGPVHCSLCGGLMWKRPQVVAVNWGGLPPSKGEPHPDIAQRIRDEQRNRDEFRKRKEEHDANDSL